MDSVLEHICTKFPAWTKQDQRLLASLLYVKICMKDFMDTILEAPKYVDSLWRLFICETYSYATFCNNVCGHMIHRFEKKTNAQRLATTEYLISHHVKDEEDDVLVPATVPTTKKRNRADECWITIQNGKHDMRYCVNDSDTVADLYQIVEQWLETDDFIVTFEKKELYEGSLLLIKDIGVKPECVVSVRHISQ